LIDYLNTHAEAIMLVVVAILALISLLVFFGAIYSRWIINISEQKREKIREELLEKVIRYVSNDLTFEEMKKNIDSKTEFAILMEISNELDKNLEGEEEARLKRLMNLPEIRRYYARRFRSSNPLERAKACLYYSRKRDVKESLVPKMMRLTASDHPMLAYAAAMAVINHGRIGQKKVAIENLLLNKGLSNQALNDVFAEFQLKSTDEREAEAKLLMELIDKRFYSNHRTALMIRTLGELGFFESAGFLLNEFQKIPSGDYDPEIAVSLIDVLSQFGMEEIYERITSEFMKSDYSEVRKAIAKALAHFKREESVTFLKWMLADKDFYVRFHAAKSLSQFDHVDLKKLKVPTMDKDELSELIGEVESARMGEV
jgi:hypothetical protein